MNDQEFEIINRETKKQKIIDFVKKNKNIKVKRIVFINKSNSPVAIAQVLIKEFYLFLSKR